MWVLVASRTAEVRLAPPPTRSVCAPHFLPNSLAALWAITTLWSEPPSCRLAEVEGSLRWAVLCPAGVCCYCCAWAHVGQPPSKQGRSTHWAICPQPLLPLRLPCPAGCVPEPSHFRAAAASRLPIRQAAAPADPVAEAAHSTATLRWQQRTGSGSGCGAGRSSRCCRAAAALRSPPAVHCAATSGSCCCGGCGGGRRGSSA